jgi:hypothetical protein
MTSFTLSYDYRCPFAKNLHLHLITALRNGAAFDVTFAPWTMSQGHKSPTGPDVWDDPARDAEHLALATSISVRDLQPTAFLDVHEALFRARHERGLRLNSQEDIVSALEGINVDLDAVWADIASRRPHQVLAETYAQFQGYDAFGVPTLVMGDDATFIRYMYPPTDDATASVTLFQTLVGLQENFGALNEFKHTKVPF